MQEIETLFSPRFVEKLMQNFAPKSVFLVQSVEVFEIDNSASILVTLASGNSTKQIGHFGLAVAYTENGMPKEQKMVMKVKPHSTEITTMLNALAQACGGTLAEIYPAYQHLTGFHHTHQREQEIYKNLPSTLTPLIFGTYSDTEQDIYLILMEYLENVELLNAVMNPDSFSDLHIKTVLQQMANWHAKNLQENLPLDKNFWTDCPSESYMQQLIPLWKALLQNVSQHFPQLYSLERTHLLEKAISYIPDYWKVLEKIPKTLIHNDLNPRNICFKIHDGQLNLCTYDWELATFHIPQYEIVEFLCFVLDENRYHLRKTYAEF
ncbi:MAG: phosphotransferase, partial [Verrucomicrobia bacterium]|nr:phosphotransferase [Cytophagales bacterium]